MNVEALDHVNIITDKLDETAEFYGKLLGLVRKDAPPPLTPETATWMFDAENRAIIHINSLDCYRTYDREVQPGSLTGALHHVALKCVGYDEVKGRLDAMGAGRRRVACRRALADRVRAHTGQRARAAAGAALPRRSGRADPAGRSAA